MTKGSLFTLRIHESKNVLNQDALKIFGVQIAKFLPEGWVHRQGLTPSRDLLFKAKGLEKEGKWDENAFTHMYLPLFLKGIKEREQSKAEIQEIATTLNNGIDVYYACYCKNHHLCHRSIVADIFERNGYHVIRQ